MVTISRDVHLQAVACDIDCSIGVLSAVQISVEGAVTAVKHIADSHDATGLNTGRAEVLYGTHNGILGQLFLDHMTVKKGWQIKSSVHKGS